MELWIAACRLEQQLSFRSHPWNTEQGVGCCHWCCHWWCKMEERKGAFWHPSSKKIGWGSWALLKIQASWSKAPVLVPIEKLVESYAWVFTYSPNFHPDVCVEGKITWNTRFSSPFWKCVLRSEGGCFVLTREIWLNICTKFYSEISVCNDVIVIQAKFNMAFHAGKPKAIWLNQIPILLGQWNCSSNIYNSSFPSQTINDMSFT